MRREERLRIEKEWGFEGISDKHRLFVKNYIACGFQQGKAYGMTYPDCQEENWDSCASDLIRSDQGVKAFLAYERAKWERKVDISIDKLIAAHMVIIKGFERMNRLLKRSKLTDEEAQQLFRMQKTFKDASYRNSLREIGLLKGFYVDKHEYTSVQTFELSVPVPPVQQLQHPAQQIYLQQPEQPISIEVQQSLQLSGMS